MSRRAMTVITLVVVVAFVVVAVAPAFAAAPASLALHARLVGSTPKDGSTVETAEQVVLVFNEDVDPKFVKVNVKGPDGSETDGSPTVAGPEVTQALSPDLPSGTHTVTYRVVSTDGHPVAGTVTFTTTQAPASASPSSTASATPTPSPSASVSAPASASPAPTVTTTPASDDSGGGLTPWLVVGAVTFSPCSPWAPRGAPSVGRRPTRLRTPRRMPRTSPATPPRAAWARVTTAQPRGPDRFRRDAGRLLMSPSRAISSIGRAADS